MNPSGKLLPADRRLHAQRHRKRRWTTKQREETTNVVRLACLGTYVLPASLCDTATQRPLSLRIPTPRPKTQMEKDKGPKPTDAW